MTSSTAAPAAFTGIPVVTLAGWREAGADRQAFAEDLVRTCHEVGFFTLVDHGIDEDDIDSYFAILAAFFALPEAVKARSEPRITLAR